MSANEAARTRAMGAALKATQSAGDGECPLACSRWAYRAARSPYRQGKDEFANVEDTKYFPPGSLDTLASLHGSGQVSLWRRQLFFLPAAPSGVTVAEEYVVYDASGILASLGGSVGLFLGLSVFGCGSRAVRLAAGWGARLRKGKK